MSKSKPVYLLGSSVRCFYCSRPAQFECNGSGEFPECFAKGRDIPMCHRCWDEHVCENPVQLWGCKA